MSGLFPAYTLSPDCSPFLQALHRLWASQAVPSSPESYCMSVWRVGQGGRKGARISTWPTPTSVTLFLRKVKIYLRSWSSQGYVITCEFYGKTELSDFLYLQIWFLEALFVCLFYLDAKIVHSLDILGKIISTTGSLIAGVLQGIWVIWGARC